MSHLDSSALATYNSLLDPHLQSYFSNERVQSHLRHSGLINRRGEIIGDREYRTKLVRHEHKKHVRQTLAENIVHRAIDMERARQAELQRQLDIMSKAALVNNVKESRRRCTFKCANISNSNDIGLLSLPSSWTQIHNKGENLHAGDENVHDKFVEQKPRLSRVQSAHADNDHHKKYSSKSPNRHRHYLNRPKSSLPQRTFTQKKHFRLITKSSDSPLSNPPCKITMIYYGPHTKIDYDHSLFEPVDEIIVMQQHCGGENLIVFKKNLRIGDEFSFNSRRHSDYPLGLSLYINGLIDSRISTCCEYKHRYGVRLGGERGHFAIVSVQGSRPCLKCRFDKKLRLQQYGDSAKDSNETDGGKNKPITISIPISDRSKTMKEPVKISVKHATLSDKEYVEDFDESVDAEKSKDKDSSDSTASRKMIPSVPVREQYASDTSSVSTKTSDKIPATKTWQITFHTSNISIETIELADSTSISASLKLAFISMDGKTITDPYKIEIEDFPQCFQSNRPGSFRVKLQNIGKPKQIQFTLEVEGYDDEDIKWHVDHVMIK